VPQRLTHGGQACERALLGRLQRLVERRSSDLAMTYLFDGGRAHGRLARTRQTWRETVPRVGRAHTRELDEAAVSLIRDVAIVDYASWMSPPATLLIWFQLRSPELAEDFERLMAEDRDIVRGSLDTISNWRLSRPADVPGQSIGQADYVLIAEILEVERFEQQASEHIQRLEGDLAHFVSSRGMLILRPVL
jgi:hypothetical protein